MKIQYLQISELYPDPTYDPLLDKSWWSLNWKKAIQWIAFSVVLLFP
ncbi:MAG: hypothetical protein ACLUG4_08775 [Bacilli bacterium]